MGHGVAHPPPSVRAARPRPRRRPGCREVVGLVVTTTGLSIGDGCLVGTWRGEAFGLPFRAFLDGREVSAVVQGGAGVGLTIASDGKARSDYEAVAPLTGAACAYRIEGTYAGSTVERWQAGDGRVKLSGTDTSL